MGESYQLLFVGLRLHAYTHMMFAGLHGNGKVRIVFVGAHPCSVQPDPERGMLVVALRTVILNEMNQRLPRFGLGQRVLGRSTLLTKGAPPKKHYCIALTFR